MIGITTMGGITIIDPVTMVAGVVLTGVTPGAGATPGAGVIPAITVIPMGRHLLRGLPKSPRPGYPNRGGGLPSSIVKRKDYIENLYSPQ